MSTIKSRINRANKNRETTESNGSTGGLTIAALGVVFGDIGTSPLYALREVFHGANAIPVTSENILGILSLVLWSLILVVSIKYLLFVMKADNNGEGGVLALTALAAPPRLVGPRDTYKRILLYLGLFGSALLFGDGIITPAISVLSAVEGLQIATPFFSPFVLPITITILALLFLSQKQGTAKIGAIFGPIILIWMLTIAVLGILAIIENPIVLSAINPLFAVDFFQQNGFAGFFVLGAVFLVVTGGEALYADMGHFGINPIRIGWFYVVLPSLILNYLGQGAYLLTNPQGIENPFYHLAPSWALFPLVVIATLSTVIASQALISGVYSLTSQAIQLGYAPRIRIIHTSSQEIGQIYIPNINWALFVLTCWLVLEFKTSSALASAYGVSVSLTMVITTILACSVAIHMWKWNFFKSIMAFVFFLLIDLLFFGANFVKITDGGWFPLTVGVIIFILMTTWRKGRLILMSRLREKSISFAQFLSSIENQHLARVQGVAFFMTGDPEGVPQALLHNVKHNRVLHQKNIFLTILTEDVPHIPKKQRLEIHVASKDFYRITAYYGFMETPDINEIIESCVRNGIDIKLSEITFFLGRETLLPSASPGMAIWREKLFVVMSRNAERATAYFNIPTDQVVEMGLQVEL